MVARWASIVLAPLCVCATAQSPAPSVDMGKARSAYEAAMAAKPSQKVCDACTWWHKVEATLDLANSYMYAPDLLPKDKYPAALRLYRAALKLDPSLREAEVGAETIVSIYKGMGREVPE